MLRCTLFRSVVLCALSVLGGSSAVACPLVAVPQVSAVATVGVQSLAVVQPQVAVQTFALPQVAVPQVSVQAVAVPVLNLSNVQVVQQAACGQRVQRAGAVGRVLGNRRLLPSARSVSVVR